MSFREKSDWATFISLWAFGFFFVEVARGLMYGHPPGAYYFNLFWVLLGVLVLIQVVSHVALALRTPDEARAPADERERAIAQRSLFPAYYVMLVGAFLLMGTLHLGFNAWKLAHSLLFVLWVAELVRYGTRLWHYRREA